MSDLLAKVEIMAQYVELYEDEVRVQMPLHPVHVIKLKDIVSIDYKRANFFIAGKLAIKYREKGASESAYFPFNFMLNDGMQTLVTMLNAQKEMLAGDKGPGVVIKEVIKVRCRYCEGLMDENADTCPVCGRPR